MSTDRLPTVAEIVNATGGWTDWKVGHARLLKTMEPTTPKPEKKEPEKS